MDLIFKSPTDKIWIDIYRCPDLVERMLLDDGGAGVSPDNAGVWHLSITFTRQRSGWRRRGGCSEGGGYK